MTITSVGYAGTVGEAEWANMVPRVGGAFYSVNGYADFRVTVAAGTRTVQVAPGTASGAGVYATSNAIETASLTSVAAGTRWDLVVLRRNWSTKESTIVVIAGGSTKALPPRSTTPGTQHDQPLALVRVINGSTAIQEIADLRCVYSSGGMVAFDDAARGYLGQIGTVVRIGDITWTRAVNSSGSAEWVSDETTARGWSLAHVATAARSWLTRHIAESVDRTFLTTNPSTTTDATYIGLTDPADTTSTVAVWFQHAGLRLMTFLKTGAIDIHGDVAIDGRVTNPNLPWAMAQGRRVITNEWQTFQFPSGKFNRPPIMTATLQDGDYDVRIQRVTTDGYWMRHTGPSGPRTASWIATQASSTSAEG